MRSLGMVGVALCKIHLRWITNPPFSGLLSCLINIRPPPQKNLLYQKFPSAFRSKHLGEREVKELLVARLNSYRVDVFRHESWDDSDVEKRDN